MSQKESLTLGEYLADLRSQRAKIDGLIAAIEETLGQTESRTQDVPENGASGHRRRGPYSGMTIAAAAIQFLRSAGKPQRTAQVMNALRDGGLKSSSKSLYRTIYSTLDSHVDKGSITKSEGKWGLPEWEQK